MVGWELYDRFVRDTAAYLERRLQPVDMLDEDGYAQIEANADTILEEVGVAFQEFPSALELWRDAGADIINDVSAAAEPGKVVP